MRHRQSAILATAILSCVLLLGCEGKTVVHTEASGEDRIQVSGSARLEVRPDVAAVSLGVQVFDADAIVAVTRNNERAAAVQDALRGLGVAEADLETTNFSITPQRAYSEDRPDSISGFWVNNTVAATVRDLSLVGTALQAAIAAGANQVNGLQFTVSNPDSLEDEARRLAVLDARRRAEVLAAAAGVRVGRAVYLSESSATTPPYYRGDAALDAGEGVPVTPGDVEITAQVNAIFALE